MTLCTVLVVVSLFVTILMLMQHAKVALGSHWRHDLEQGVEA